MKRLQVTHLMRCSGTVQLAAAACSLQLAAWTSCEFGEGTHSACYCYSIAIALQATLALSPIFRFYKEGFQEKFFRNIVVSLGMLVTTLTLMMRLFLSCDD